MVGTPGTLYIVATPIGNMEDITLRALETLRGVALIACEDTRQTRKLLMRHGIRAQCVSCHKFNESRAVTRILQELLDGHDVAVVSDGGTPAISDPGYLVVSRAVEAGVEIRPLPGPNAAIAALSASGLPTNEFTFRGFLPHRRGERRRALAGFSVENPTQVFYESPARIAETLADMAEILGPRRCSVVRELTKKFEQWYRGPLDEVAAAVAAGRQMGEFCIIVEGASAAVMRGAGPAGAAARSERATAILPPATGSAALLEGYRSLLAGGFDRRAAIKKLARSSGLSRSEVYRRIVEAGREAEAAGSTPGTGGTGEVHTAGARFARDRDSGMDEEERAHAAAEREADRAADEDDEEDGTPDGGEEE